MIVDPATVGMAVGWVMALPIILMFAVFLTELVSGLLPSREAAIPQSDATVAIIVPAHNEAGSIESTVHALKADLPAGARLLVIADNCSDATSALARLAGAEVFERNDFANRGKGFALAHARQVLRDNPPSCVVVMDADCSPRAGSLAALRDAVVAWGVPVQAINLLRPDLSAPPMVQISNFAFTVKNLVRQRGAARLGGAAFLGGTGMALPWSVFEAAPLASNDLVEDLSLGLFAVREGYSPRFLEAAYVVSDAASQASTLVQRTRWEHGFLATARKRAMPMLAEGIARGRWSQIWLALHLSVPPLALLALIGVAMLVVLALIRLITAGGGADVALAALMAGSGVAVLLAWALHGREALAASALVRLPLYVLWKIPIYLKLFRKPETEWVRTRRADD
jgi:cellulose synthase/poly-beta-1,6-N-acetylglucosamine synthase-like glycosyltransferase